MQEQLRVAPRRSRRFRQGVGLVLVSRIVLTKRRRLTRFRLIDLGTVVQYTVGTQWLRQIRRTDLPGRSSVHDLRNSPEPRFFPGLRMTV